MDINRAIYRLPHSGEHLKLDITHGIDRIRTSQFKQLCRTRISMACMGGYLEVTVCRNLSCFSHFVERPKAALVVNKESAAAKSCSSLNILYCTNDLLLTAETISHTNALLSVNRGRGICSRTRSDSKNKICLPLMCQLHHLADVLVCQTHYSLCLSNSVQIKAIAVHCLQQSLHYLRALYTGNLKTVLSAVLEALLRCGQIVGVSPGQTDRFQKFSCFIHTVHSHFLLILYSDHQ